MQPLPETSAALVALARGSGAGAVALVERFTEAAARTRSIAPDCVGLTLTFLMDGASFTWVATGVDEATLDAVQYLDGGPCVSAADEGVVVVDSDEGPLDERQWQTFAAASARAGVSSTLSIPLAGRDGAVYGGLNLYGRTPHAFDGIHDELAAQYGGWAGGAVTNADLSFTTMARSMATPRTLEDAAVANNAVGMIMAAHDVDEPTARRTLGDAAERAGVSETDIARVLLSTHLR